MLKLFVIVGLWSSLSFAQSLPTEPVPEIKAFEQIMTVSVFNIQKSENGSWRAGSFKRLVEASDLVLIQESVDRFADFKFEGANYIDYFYKSWGSNSYNTGLSTLTKIPFDEAKRIVSKDTEPVAATPKVTSIEKYSVKGLAKKFAVANTHGINFTGLSAFRRQMSAVAKELEKHDGPMIWVGDFNTWSNRRKRYLDSLMKTLGLKEIKFSNRSEVFLVLDLAYAKGVKVSDAEQLQLSISDHEPLQFKVEFTPDSEQAE